MQIDPSFIVSLFCLAGPFLGVVMLAVIARLLTRRKPSAVRLNASSPQPRNRGTVREQAYAPIHTLLTDAEQSFFAASRSATPQELLICP